MVADLDQKRETTRLSPLRVDSGHYPECLVLVPVAENRETRDAHNGVEGDICSAHGTGSSDKCQALDFADAASASSPFTRRT
jgi:hypothetical protein